jgi:hypothetical protein
MVFNTSSLLLFINYFISINHNGEPCCAQVPNNRQGCSHPMQEKKGTEGREKETKGQGSEEKRKVRESKR